MFATPCARSARPYARVRNSPWRSTPITPLNERDLANLTVPEASLYDDLRDNRIGRGVRLEQELIDFAWVLEALMYL